MELDRAVMWVRRYHGLSQEKLAKRVGVSFSYLRLIETKRKPSPVLLKKIAAGLNIPVTFFYFLEEIDEIKETNVEFFAFMLSHYPLLWSVYEMERKFQEGLVDERTSLPHLLKSKTMQLEKEV